MNVKVTGVPMRTRWMSTSVDPRVGQLETRPCRRGVWEYKHKCTKAPRLHDDLTTRDTRPNQTTTGLALWSGLTLETRSHPWVPAVHGCLVRQEGCGWPDTTTTNTFSVIFCQFSSFTLPLPFPFPFSFSFFFFFFFFFFLFFFFFFLFLSPVLKI